MTSAVKIEKTFEKKESPLFRLRTQKTTNDRFDYIINHINCLKSDRIFIPLYKNYVRYKINNGLPSSGLSNCCSLDFIKSCRIWCMK